jgi:type 1 glutamine amidotransferase
MNKRSALVFYGGWEGHHPAELSQLLADDLTAAGFSVARHGDLQVLDEAAALAAFDLIVPCWTMGAMTEEQSKNLTAAVRGGTGLAGVHGGMGDAFRGNIDFEWMVGGHFVGHPHVGPYSVRKTLVEHELTAGLPCDFPYDSEQYYLLVDPANTVLLETDYAWEGTTVNMPVAWVKTWGRGRVFYSSLGHALAEFAEGQPMREFVRRGLVWAARSHSN